jgi:hypothetical protein
LSNICKTRALQSSKDVYDQFENTDTGGLFLPSFLEEAERLRPFAPPFRFSAFFSPEDTLLCVCASDAAFTRAKEESDEPTDIIRVAELTTGSGLVGLHLLSNDDRSRLLGLDIDPRACEIAEQNARLLGLERRAWFECSDIWSDAALATLIAYDPNLLICNPPYVPEPPGENLALEAGAGPDGTAHILRTLELASTLRSDTLALSWCSLSDPARVVRSAGEAGYALSSLFVVAIADGEYSGSVRDYLRSLPHAYLNERSETVTTIAPDGSARFGYLLIAGEFSRTKLAHDAAQDADAVEHLCRRFASRGLSALVHPELRVPVTSWLLDRWDELELRVLLHGRTNMTRIG